MDDIVRFCRERAASYGALRKSSLTAIALDKAADRIAELERAAAMQTLLEIDGKLYDAKGGTE